MIFLISGVVFVSLHCFVQNHNPCPDGLSHRFQINFVQFSEQQHLEIVVVFKGVQKKTHQTFSFYQL